MTRHLLPLTVAAAIVLGSGANGAFAAPAPNQVTIKPVASPGGPPPPPPPPSFRPPPPPPPAKPKVGPPGVAAIVNGEKISIDSVKTMAYKRFAGQVVKQVIQTKLVDQEAKKQNIKVLPAEIDAEIAKVKKQIESRPGMTIEAALKQANMTMSDLREMYRGRVELQKLAAKKVKPTKMLHIEHILVMTANPSQAPDTKVHTDDEAKAIIAKIQADLKAGKKFEDVAKTYSEDPSNKDKGGDLGVVTPTSQLDQNFLQAALKLKAGETTPTEVKSMYGYHIIKAVSTSETATGAEKAMYAAAQEQDKQQQIGQASQTLLSDLQAKAKIDDFINQ